MHIILAEDIGGWLEMGVLILGSLGSSGLALGALYPALQRMRLLTVCLITPALVMAVLAICYLAKLYTNRTFHDHEEIVVNYIQPWFLIGFPPLATGVLSGTILLWKLRKK